MDNKLIILVEENPQIGTFEATCAAMGLYDRTDGCIDPLYYLSPESHALEELYKDIFKEDLANELLAYLINKHPNDLVYDVISDIYGIENNLILVNSTILTENECNFIATIFDGHTLMYRLTGNVEKDARHMYDESKKYRDTIEYIGETEG